MKNKKPCKSNDTLGHAIKQVESYITSLKPQSHQDIKKATNNLSKAALGAYLSVHTYSETLEFINQLAHTLVDDISSHLYVPAEHIDKIH